TPRHIGKLWHFAKTFEATVRNGLHQLNENDLLQNKSVRRGLHIIKNNSNYWGTPTNKLANMSKGSVR
ncbi:hypothetical protein, partial [Pseudomonas sp. 21615526]|uniref:hypothetical protein n=1 Tax=Pseudomonas sp. 21615526 TaxID=2738811 RepID=UPI001C4C3068